MDIINSFIKKFEKDRINYDNIKEKAFSLIDKKLKESGILSINTSRLKNSESLREKLIKRNKERTSPYKDIVEIEDDIVDLIGIRIALYFPNDFEKVKNIIDSTFKVEKIKDFPEQQNKNDIYKQIFPGYVAKHFRVYLKHVNENQNTINNKQIVEIQVATLLMHAWAEVDHDLRYKQLKGDLSYDEYESLDEINGLIIASEIALQKLQRISQLRITSEEKEFGSHYELASYLYDKLKSSKDDIVLGDVETLFKVMKKANRLTIKKLGNDIEKIDKNNVTPYSEQLIDIICYGNSLLTQYTYQVKIVHQHRTNNNKEDIYFDFLRQWISLERTVRKITKDRLSDITHNNFNNIYRFIELEGIDCIKQDELRNLQNIRNMIVHGQGLANDIDMHKCIEQVKGIYQLLVSYDKNN